MACTGRIRREFRLQSFLLAHSTRLDFTRTPWLSNQLPFVVYRAAICLYQVVAFIISMKSLDTPIALAYLTNLGFILLTVHIILSAILCFADYFNWGCLSDRKPTYTEDQPTFTEIAQAENDEVPNSPDNTRAETNSNTTVQEPTSGNVLPWYYKGYWILYNVAFGGGLFITIAYWALLRGVGTSTGPRRIMTHAINAVVIVIDIFVSGLPYRLFHFIYPTIFGLSYILFTVIYWAGGGTGLTNQPWIYPVLDYGGKPGLAAGVVTASVFLAMPLCHGVIFGLTFGRDSVLRFLQKRRLPVGEGTALELQAEERV